MIQLIATDMDGTLLDEEKQLPAQLPALLEELYRRDITFAVASGRSHMMLTNLFGELAEEIIFICDNGACVMYPHEAPLLHSLPKDVIHRILDACCSLSAGVPVLCGFHHIYYPENDNAAMQHEIQRYYRNPQVVPYDDLYAVDEPILKVALCDTNGPTKEAYPVMHEALGDAYELVSYDHIQVTVTEKGPSADSTTASTDEGQEGTESETSEGPVSTSKAETGQ